MPSTGDEAHQDVRLRRNVHLGRDLALGDAKAQRLLEHCLEAIMQLIDARLQALVFVDQGIANQYARHAAILLRKTQQHRDDRLKLTQSAFFFGRDFVDQRE